MRWRKTCVPGCLTWAFGGEVFAGFVGRATDAGGISGAGAADVVFHGKDKERMLNAVRRVLPRNRGLAGQVWNEMNQPDRQLYPRKS